MDDLTTGEDGKPTGRKRRIGLFLPILIAILFVVGLGTAAAFAVPVVSITADKPLAQMLPATTLYYMSADLNPSGTTKNNLDRIVHAFTDQPAWKNISKQFNQVTKPSSSGGACYQQTQNELTSNLSYLGHVSALALISAQGLKINGNTTGLDTAVKKDVVFLASLDVHQSLFGALSGFKLSLQSTTITYKGTTIYQEKFPACAKTSSQSPDRVYVALDKGYVVAGFLPDPIERIIDTGAGDAPNLSSDATYTGLESRLPGDQLGGEYLNAKALKATGALKALKSVPGGNPIALSQALQSSAAGLYADPDGLRLDTVGPASTPASTSPAAGQIASQLRSDTLMLLSIQGVASNIRSAAKQFKGLFANGITKSVDPIVTDLTADLSGEVDLALLHANGTLSFGTGSSALNLPLVLAWKVGNDAAARSHLDDVVRRVGASKQLKTATAPDGTSYQVTKQGFGYAVRSGWAIVSLSIAKALDELSSSGGQNLASAPAYQRGLSAVAKPSAIFYLDATDLRLQLEAALLPTVPSSIRQQYQTTAKPIIAPISSISFGSGTTNDGKASVTRVFVRISPPK
jgi:hypothetical protein